MEHRSQMSTSPIVFAVVAAVLFGLGTPFSKMLLGDIPPVALAGIFYLGAFIGLSFFDIFRRTLFRASIQAKSRIGRNDIPWLLAATASGGVVAPVCLMLGLNMISGFSASLLLNLEGVMTAIIAASLFKEHLGRRIPVAILLMTAAGVLLSWNPEDSKFSVGGPLLLLVAAVAWGFDNNFTRSISSRDSVEIAQIKGLIAGSISTMIALVIGWDPTAASSLIGALVLGSLSYGASLVFFVLALQGLGASRTGAFFSLGPFVGAIASVFLLSEWLGWIMLPAAMLMLAGVLIVVYERHSHKHTHEEFVHEHLHSHDDAAHAHTHIDRVESPHVHAHTHPSATHDHAHWPDVNHRHAHKNEDEDGQ